MVHSRLLAAATAALLLLSPSVGAVGAAVASEEPPSPASVELAPQPASFDGTGGDTPVIEPPSDPTENQDLEENQDSPEGCADDSAECDVPTRDCVVVIWQMPRWVDQWTPTWPQSYVSVHDSDCAATQIDAQLFPVPDACGTQYQLDKYYVSDKTSALIALGVLQGYGPEEDLVPGTWGTLVHNPGCVAAAVNVVATFSPLPCDGGPGSWTAGLVDPSDPNASTLAWTTTAGIAPSAVANNVSNATVVTVSVRAEAPHLDDVVVIETSRLGVASTVVVEGIETTLITWTFTFEESESCELGASVVPIVTEVDYCVGSGSSAVRVATFTVKAAENATFAYSVNGGSAIDIVFSGGVRESTFAVNPGDRVVVTATAATGFALPDDYDVWSHSFVGSAFCPDTLPATVAAAEIAAVDCVRDPVVVTLTNEGGVIWTLNGAVVEGNAMHELPGGSAVQLTAKLEGATAANAGGWTWNDPEQQTAWAQEAVPEDTCLASLADTGGSSMTGWFGAAAVVMMLAGMGIAYRRSSLSAKPNGTFAL